MEAHPVLLFLFVFVAKKLPTLQYSFLFHKGFGIIQVVCCMVSRFSFQLVVCCLQLQAKRCPTILQKQIASDSLQGTRGNKKSSSVVTRTNDDEPPTKRICERSQKVEQETGTFNFTNFKILKYVTGNM